MFLRCRTFGQIVIWLMMTKLHSTLAAIALSVVAFTAAPVHLAAQTPDTQDSVRQRPAVVKHTVKRGDTLWDIAKAYLKDPFRWPEVFHANTDIVKNPHWIYPGQILTIEGVAVRDEVVARVNDQGFVADEPTNEPTTAFVTRRAPTPLKQAVLVKPPVYTVRRGEYDAAPFMVDSKKPLGNGVIAGTVDRLALGLKSDAGFQINDQLYVTAPAGTTPRRGDQLLIARAGDVVLDVGQVIEPAGVFQVDSVTSTGVVAGSIVRQFGQIARKSVVLPFDRSFQETTVRPVLGNYGDTTRVIWIKSAPILSSLQTYLIVSAPPRSVRPGDEFTLYDKAKQNEDGIATPSVAAATLQVVRVTPYGATGVIVSHQQPVVRTGMKAQLTAKMP